MKVIYLCLFIFLLLSGDSFAQRIRVKSKWIKLKEIKDDKILSFKNDSIRIDFSAREIENYISKDFKQQLWKVKEYEGKRQLKDSLKNRGSLDTIFIKIEVPFTMECVRGDIPAAMLQLSYDFLKKGHGKVMKNNKCYHKIKHKIFDGPYGNKVGVFIIDKEPFLRYVISLGE